jgi:hypothetical protein
VHVGHEIELQTIVISDHSKQVRGRVIRLRDLEAPQLGALKAHALFRTSAYRHTVQLVRRSTMSAFQEIEESAVMRPERFVATPA